MSSENPVKKILVLSANPKGTKSLRLNEEIREIQEGLQLATQRDKFEIKSTQAARYRDIQRSILKHKPQIVHFSGHGAGESGLVFEDEIGQQKLVDAQALAGFFELFAANVECVVLNACYSQIQAKAIAKHIDYVIGMSKEIGDKAAIEFAVGFYDALGDGSEFEFAYKYGCSSIRMAGIPEHLTPQLLRKQDDSGDNIDTTPLITSLPPNARQTIVVSSPPAQEESNIIEYLQKVEEFAADGVISDIESHILDDLQKKLGLTDKQARAVQNEVLESYEIYKQQFNKKVDLQGYPLTEKAQAELKKLQDYYNIKDEYIKILDREAEKQEAEKLQLQLQEEEEEEEEEDKRLQQQKLEEAKYQRQQEAEKLRQEQEQQRLEYQRQQAELQKQRENKTFPTQPFDFETATLTVRSTTEKRSGILGFLGETSTSISCDINRSRKRAESFKEDLGNGIFLEMVKIPGGNFLTGSPENELERLDRESPQHNVNIQPFFMGKFPVTQEQYQAIMGENPSHFQGKNKPVECVSWDNAVDFCGRISKRTGKTYRLPSEAEWEYACRSGTTTQFHFGETITTDLANYRGTDWNYEGTLYPGNYGNGYKGEYREQTTDVGNFPANTFGLYDMHGNVWEWCKDNWHENYQGTPNNGTSWISDDNENNYRLLRGGSWHVNPWLCRCAFRFRYERDGRGSNIGFRVVVSPRTS